MPNYNDLPADIKRHIMKMLPDSDLVRMARVNRLNSHLTKEILKNEIKKLLEKSDWELFNDRLKSNIDSINGLRAIKHRLAVLNKSGLVPLKRVGFLKDLIKAWSSRQNGTCFNEKIIAFLKANNGL